MIGVFWFGLATLAVAWLTASATAVRSVSRLWLRSWAERRLGGSTAAKMYLEYPQRLLAAAGTAGAVVVFLAGALAIRLAGDRVLPVLPVLVTGGAVVLVVGHLVPRMVARRWAATVAPILLPALRAITRGVGPLTTAGQRFARPLLPEPESPPAERGILEDLLREGVLEGVAAHDEMEIIAGIAQFGERRVEEVMTPRDQVFALDERTPIAELCAQIAMSGYSRVPIYRTSIDAVTGMVLAFDLLSVGGTGPLVRPVALAAATQGCNDLLIVMLRQRRHLAIVTDASGRTAGIVTLEDLLEELVGDIRDEHDEPDPLPSSARG